MAAAQRAQAAGILYNGVGVAALRKAGTRHKLAVPPAFDHHGAAAFFADLVGGDILHFDLFALHVLFGGFQAFFKALVEIVHCFDPVRLTGFHNVQLFLHIGTECRVHDIGELFQHDLVHRAAQRGGFELFLLLFHIAAVHNGGNDRRIGGRAANTVFFQRMDQRCFSIVRRRLGEFLLRRKLVQFQVLAHFQRGQGGFFLLLIVGGFLIQSGKAVKRYMETRCAEDIIPRRDVGRNGIHQAVCHLGCHKAAPDQAVQLGFIAGDAALHLVRRQFRH